MDHMQEHELPFIWDCMNDSQREDYERARMISYWSAKPYFKIKPVDILRFPDEQESNNTNTIVSRMNTTDEDISQLKKLFMNRKQDQ